MAERELLFSVTASDCAWEYMRGTGAGGQKRNKTSSKVRCTHVASGAVGESDKTRSQHLNKQDAFRKMAESKTFQNWHRIETARVTGKLAEINETVNKAMLDCNLRVEVFSGKGWAPEPSPSPDPVTGGRG